MAMGILMERHKLSAEQAFDRLRSISSQRNVKLPVVAEKILYTGDSPEIAGDSQAAAPAMGSTHWT